MTWAEICEDKLLATLPYRIESDRLVLGYRREKFIRETLITASARGGYRRAWSEFRSAYRASQ